MKQLAETLPELKARNVSMLSGPRLLFFMGLHIPLALLMNAVPLVATVHSLVLGKIMLSG